MNPRNNQSYQHAIDKHYLANVQYAGMTNYQYRRNDTLLEWYANQYIGAYDLNHTDNVLEIGCGDGTFWKYIASTHHFQPHVVFTDIAEKMLAECERNLSTLNLHAEYKTSDIDALPFGSGTFSAALAHKVIYHAHNPENAISEISRVLKPNGFLGISVLNSGAYGSIWKLANSINSQVPDQSLSSRFSNLEADAILPKYFSSIDKKTYTSSLSYTTSDTIVEFVKSNPIVQPLKLSSNFFTLFKEKVDEKIEEKGAFECDYNSNLYLCRKGL